MIERNRSSNGDLTSPRRDDRNRVSKPSRAPSQYTGAPAHARPQHKNQSHEDEQTRQWVAQEDTFVLKQAKKKADIRVREGRAKPIDWLAVTLRVIDPDRDLLDDDEEEVQMNVVDPEGVFEGLNEEQLTELERDITSYLALETIPRNQEYWRTMQVICKDRRNHLKPAGREGRAVESVSADVERLLSPKTYEQLEVLEKQINAKLRSNDDIDVDYWEQLLRALLVWKAKAKLKKVYQSVLEARLDVLRKEQLDAATAARAQFSASLAELAPQAREPLTDENDASSALSAPTSYEPEPLLKLTGDENPRDVVDEEIFTEKITAERRRILKLGFVPPRQNNLANAKTGSSLQQVANISSTKGSTSVQRFSNDPNEDFSHTTKALYDREVARGIDENEEIFTGEETVVGNVQPQWADKYRPRKPRYFNRVQMGYEWNKYNQTHYDHDNPPPKVVQGYKFNIFYPDLIDRSKAPTFRIIREHGRKRGESFAPAGEEDTCLIRFIAGPPYEDIAFRIVDKEWDYSAKQDRGFRSSFDKVSASAGSQPPYHQGSRITRVYLGDPAASLSI